jgi:signal transduction histidine kinase
MPVPLFRGYRLAETSLNGIFSRKNLMLVILVISLAASISAVSYQYSLYTSQQIEELAVQDIRSNSDIQVHDLANSFSNKMGDVVNTLQIISKTRLVLEGDVENAKPMFNQADDSSPEIIDFYMWLDSEGKLVWLSNINQTTYETFKGTDLSYRLYFTTPKDTNQLYYSSVIDSNDHVARLYVSYPILGEPSDQFRGLVAAGIRSDAIGDFLESQFSPKLQGEIVLLDNTGIIMYSEDPQYVGKNVFGIRFQSLLASSNVETLRAMNEGFTEALAGNSGMKDIIVNEEKATFVYKPIILEEKQFGVLYMVTPHAYATDVAGLIDQQQNFSLMLIAITSAAAIGVILIILTWNKRLEQTVKTKTAELTMANEQLKTHDKMQREFINIAAHELRTPIQPILGVAEMLEDEMGDKKEDIRMIARNARRLERLTRDLLDVAKIDGQSLKLSKEKFSISELISVLIQDYRKRFADGHDTVLEYESKESIIVEADKERITQVISNLLDNALKFTKNGRIVITTKKENDGKVAVSVQDTGTGMEPEIIPRLFTKFTSRSQSGTGLGLFISKSIVEAHGGEIWGKNNENEGATFSFTIP